jgi:hypothetical protein
MRVAIFTAWPELIKDSGKNFELIFKESCQQLVQHTFASQDVGANLFRYVAWGHDKQWHAEYDLCLFVSVPVCIEISDLLMHLDSDHSTYADIDHTVILYQRRPQWKEKTVNVEKSPNPVGVIFIDCWQQIEDKSSWPEKPDNFDFYSNMKNELSKYKIANMVFHTGEFGSLSLAAVLESWRLLPNSYNIQHIEDFQRHYLAQNIHSWIVIGAHWQRCTHDKPLGFKNLLQLKTQDSALQIYSHQNCTVKFVNNDLDNPIVSTLNEQDYQLDSLTWKPNGNLFELVLE